MTKEQKTLLTNRVKGFLWGLAGATGVAGALAGLNYLAEVVPTLGLSEFAVVTIILLCEQITKYINKSLVARKK